MVGRRFGLLVVIAGFCSIVASYGAAADAAAVASTVKSIPRAAAIGSAVRAGATATRLDPPDRHARLEFTGDTLIHSPLVNTANANAGGIGYDFSPMFTRVRGVLTGADLAVCHLESPVAPAGEPLSTYPQYGIPAQIAPALAGAGYDRCSTASNHTIDRGLGGIDATVNALEAAGLTQAGMARIPAEAVATLSVANGITIAHLAYTFGFNGGVLPADQPWRSNLIDVPAIIAAAQDARTRGADFVIVNLHWGAEGLQAVTPQQLQIAMALTASPAIDLIVGEHAHVIQPIAQVNGKWVVFGMGNFLSNMPTSQQWGPESQDGEVVSVNIVQQADGTVRVDRPVVVPTWVDRTHGYVIRSVLDDLTDPSVDRATKDALSGSLQRTASVVGSYIAAGPGAG